MTVEAKQDGSLDDYQAADDLGILGLKEGGTGRRLIAGLNSVMLRSLHNEPTQFYRVQN